MDATIARIAAYAEASSFDRLPKEFTHHRELFKSRVWRSPKVWAMAKERV